MPEPERSQVLGYFTTRFGIPLDAFAELCLLERTASYSLCSTTPHLARVAGLRVQAVGLPVLRRMRHGVKPTTVALQRFGPLATRHIVDLSDAEVTVLLQARQQSVQLALQPGYVILRHHGQVLGCGLYTPGCLRSQLPRHHVSSS